MPDEMRGMATDSKSLSTASDRAASYALRSRSASFPCLAANIAKHLGNLCCKVKSHAPNASSAKVAKHGQGGRCYQPTGPQGCSNGHVQTRTHDEKEMRELTMEIWANSMNDFGAGQLPCICHQAGAHFKLAPRMCCHLFVTHLLKPWTSCPTYVLCNTSRMPQLSICSVDDCTHRLISDVLLQHLQQQQQQQGLVSMRNSKLEVWQGRFLSI